MKKFMFLLLFVFSTINTFAVSEDTKLILELIKSNQELIKSEIKSNRELIISNQRATERRFEDMNKRFEDMSKRFDMLTYIVIAGFTLLFGYLLKERKAITKDIKDDIGEYIEFKLTKKADTKVVESIINILEKLATKDPKVAEILKKHNIG
jgi:hypothetical protein